MKMEKIVTFYTIVALLVASAERSDDHDVEEWKLRTDLSRLLRARQRIPPKRMNYPDKCNGWQGAYGGWLTSCSSDAECCKDQWCYYYRPGGAWCSLVPRGKIKKIVCRTSPPVMKLRLGSTVYEPGNHRNGKELEKNWKRTGNELDKDWPSFGFFFYHHICYEPFV